MTNGVINGVIMPVDCQQDHAKHQSPSLVARSRASPRTALPVESRAVVQRSGCTRSRGLPRAWARDLPPLGLPCRRSFAVLTPVSGCISSPLPRGTLLGVCPAACGRGSCILTLAATQQPMTTPVAAPKARPLHDTRGEGKEGGRGWGHMTMG